MRLSVQCRCVDDHPRRMDFSTEELRWISRSLNEVTTGGGPIEDWGLTFASVGTWRRFEPCCDG